MVAPRSNKRRRIVIVGSGGRLGGELARRYEAEHEVIALDHGRLDLTNFEAIEAVIGGLDFERLFLTAALTAVDHCEEHENEAFLLNAEAPGQLARICAEKGAHMTHFSTDFVFDGLKEGAYTESDPPRPVSVYGASKLAGEQLVLEASPAHLVVRVAWLYGSRRPAFPEWIIEQAAIRDEVSLPADKTGSPTSAADVADLLVPLVFADGGPASGVVHLANGGSCTWQEWGQCCLDTAAALGHPLKARGVSASTLDSVTALKARRPRNSALSTARFTALTGIEPRPWRDACRAYLASTLAAGASAAA
jgi:dTDP-4-dehydrorhamnose reductase